MAITFPTDGSTEFMVGPFTYTLSNGAWIGSTPVVVPAPFPYTVTIDDPDPAPATQFNIDVISDPATQGYWAAINNGGQQNIFLLFPNGLDPAFGLPGIDDANNLPSSWTFNSGVPVQTPNQIQADGDAVVDTPTAGEEPIRVWFFGVGANSLNATEVTWTGAPGTDFDGVNFMATRGDQRSSSTEGGGRPVLRYDMTVEIVE